MRDQRGPRRTTPLGGRRHAVPGLRHRAPEPDRLVKVERPYAVAGRGPEAQIVIKRPRGQRRPRLPPPRPPWRLCRRPRRHPHRHQAQRPGPDGRLAPPPATGWRSPAAGSRLLRLRIDGAALDTPLCDTPWTCSPTPTATPSPPSHPGTPGRLFRRTRPGSSGPSLVFLGWSASCGIQLKDKSVAAAPTAPFVRSPRRRPPGGPLRPTDLGRGPPRRRRFGPRRRRHDHHRVD